MHRLTSAGTHQARFLARTFRETRLATHITRDRTLLHDRTAWNKLWRRSFWDRHAPRFPEGRLYEDIPVTLPLHFAARSVDVLADVVYYWRTREGDARSITQRRAEPGALADRLAAISDVSAYLASHGHRREKRWYDQSVVADDLKYFVNALDEGDDDFRALFLERVNAFLDGVQRGRLRPAARDRAPQVAPRAPPAAARAARGDALPARTRPTRRRSRARPLVPRPPVPDDAA